MNRMPIVPGPQWLDTVQPARVTQTSSKVWYSAMQQIGRASCRERVFGYV